MHHFLAATQPLIVKASPFIRMNEEQARERSTIATMPESQLSSSTSQKICAARYRGHHEGFTIIEIMVVLAILGVLAALAAPSFGPLIERWRVRDAAENLQSTLFFARSEAIKRGGNVTLIRIASGNGCANADAATQWGCGWTVFVDTNGNGVQSAGEETLKTMPAPTRVEINLAKSDGYILFDRWGQLDSPALKAFDFRLIPQGTSTANAGATAVCVTRVGHVKRLAKGNEACPS